MCQVIGDKKTCLTFYVMFWEILGDGMTEWACDIKENLNAPLLEGEETAEIYRREARALYETSPHRAAVKLVDAAYANDHDENSVASVLRDLKTAILLAPECGWLASAARRLFVKMGAWNEALTILEKEMALAPTADLKIACTLEAADIAWLVLDAPEKARNLVRAARQCDPKHVGSLYHDLWLSSTCGALWDAAEAAEALAKILGDPSERAVLFAFAANIRMGLGDDTGAHALFSQAVQSDKTHVYALLGLAFLEARFSNFAQAAAMWQTLAGLFDGEFCQGECSAMAGTLHYYAGDLVKAAGALDRAQKKLRVKGDILALELEATMRLGNVSKAVELEHQLISLSDCDEAKADRFVEMAQFLYKAGRVGEALEALEQAVGCGETSQGVFDLRCALYEHQGNEQTLTQAWEERLKTEQAPGIRDYLLWQLARALNRKQAFQDTLAALEGDGGGICRWQHLVALEKSAQDEEQVRFLDTWLHQLSDECMKNALTERIVMMLVERLGHPDIALRYVKTLTRPQPSFGRLLTRQLILETLDSFDALCESYLYMAQETGEPEDAKMWLMEAAGLADTTLHKPELAMKILRDLHDAAPDFVPAVEFYHHIALRLGDDKQVMMANAWRFALKAGDTGGWASENAWCAANLEDMDKAFFWFQKAMTCKNTPGRALRAYVRLLRQCGKFEEAAKVIEMCVPVYDRTRQTGKTPSDDPNEQAQPSAKEQTQGQNNETGTLTEDAPKKLVADVVAASSGILLDAADQLAMRKSVLDMKAYGTAKKDSLVGERAALYWASPTVRQFIPYVLEILNVLPPEQQALAILKASAELDCADDEFRSMILWLRAELSMRDGEDDRSNVDKMLSASLEHSYGKALRAEILRWSRNKKGENVSAWLEKYASLTQDRWIVTALLHEAALREMWIEHDMVAVCRTSRGAFKNVGNEWRSLWALERFADDGEDFQALGVLREKMAQLEPEPAARLQALKSALAPYVDDELFDHAIRVSQECLKIDPNEFTALLTLAQIAEENQNTMALAGVADRLSEASCCLDNKLSYGLWAAKLWQGIGRNDQAFNSLTSLLASDPTCMPAIAMSEQLLSALSGWEKLSLVYVRAIAALSEGQTQIELLRKHARILAEKLDDPAGASLALARILAQTPEDLDALSEQTALLAKQARWSEAVETLELRIRCTATAEDKRAANLVLADILVHQVGDLNRARRLLKRHLTQFVHDLDALRLMYDIAYADRNWTEARTTLDEMCQDVSPMMNWARLAYTRVAREAEWTNEVRVVYERQAIDAVMGHREDLETLISDYRAHGDLDRLIRVAKYDLSKATDSRRVAQYRGCVAALYVANAQHREALAFLSEVIAGDEQTDWAYLARAQALASAGQLDSAAAEFRRTLTKNLSLDQAYAPFIEVLQQLGDRVALAVAKCFVAHRQGQAPVLESCLSGMPRGFFDIELLPIERTYHEAFQYLRLMSPYMYPAYESPVKLQPLDAKHWAVTRCRQLFGQNLQQFDARIFVSALGRRMSGVRLTDPPAIVMDMNLMHGQGPAFDFWAAYAMHQAASGGALLDVMNDEETEALFRALCDASPESVRAKALKKIIAKRLPRSDRKLFKDGVPFKSPSWSGFRDVLSTRAACVAAIISASPAVALQAFPQNEALQRFILSDTYVRLLKLYWA